MQLMLTARQHDIDDLIEKLWRARVWMRQHPAAHAKNVELRQLFKLRQSNNVPPDDQPKHCIVSGNIIKAIANPEIK